MLYFYIGKTVKILVLSGKIQLSDVASALLGDGIVVLETIRTQASEIVAKIENVFNGQCLQGNEVMHLAVRVLPDQGWSDYLLYSLRCEYDKQKNEASMIKAVNQWRENGSPDRFKAYV